METPITSHLNVNDYKLIYEPSQDTFLLLDALESDLPYIENVLQPSLCLEIGSGSGVIITALSKRLKNTQCLATDINIHACLATYRTANKNNVDVECLHGNLADALRSNLVDLLVFNPPYVITTEEEYRTACVDGEVACSWAGGPSGRMVIDQLLKNLPAILSSKGVMYLLLLKENDPDAIIVYLKDLGFKAVKLMERTIPGERLCVLKIYR